MKYQQPHSHNHWIGNLFLLIGLLLIDVWLWSNTAEVTYQGWESWVFDREVQGKTVSVGAYVKNEFERTLNRVEVRLGMHVATPTPDVTAKREIPRSSRPQGVEPNGLVGRLSIPRLNLTATVREGSGEDTLRLALGHISNTAFPGQPGNVGIAGHRDTLFRPLRNIKKDDVIMFETVAGNHAYKVESTQIVMPDQVSVLQPRDYRELTLVTCYPFYYVGSAPKRFIVKARELPTTPELASLTPRSRS